MFLSFRSLSFSILCCEIFGNNSFQDSDVPANFLPSPPKVFSLPSFILPFVAIFLLPGGREKVNFLGIPTSDHSPLARPPRPHFLVFSHSPSPRSPPYFNLGLYPSLPTAVSNSYFLPGNAPNPPHTPRDSFRDTGTCITPLPLFQPSLNFPFSDRICHFLPASPPLPDSPNSKISFHISRPPPLFPFNPASSVFLPPV